jgi:arginine-tRNA-protein transferase
LPGRPARSQGFSTDALDGATYRMLLDRGFRRSGRVIYRPSCRGCRECRQLRVPTATFAASRSQRRVLGRNRDLRVSIEPCRATGEKWELYVRYLNNRHDEAMPRTTESFVDFLYNPCVESLDVCYRLDGRLIGVSVIDPVPGGWSSVYMYFDPAESRRSLGTYSVLWEIDHCREAGLGYYYLGFYVAGSRTMAYKARFAPYELLREDGTWQPVTEPVVEPQLS